MDNDQYKKIVGSVTILSGIVAFISYFLVSAAVNFNFEFFSNPAIIFSVENVNIPMLRWSMITDIFGYYLLLLPALFFIHNWLKNKTEWRNVITFCGTSYVLIGSVGASILAITWTSLLVKYPTVSPEQQETIKLLFDAFSKMIYGGLWNLIDSFFAGVWWIGVGIFIKRDYRLFGWFTISVGGFSLLDSLGTIFEIHAFAEMALNIYLILAPFWAIFLGSKLLSKNSFDKEEK